MLYEASPLFLDYVTSVRIYSLALWGFIDVILRQVTFNLRLLPHLLWNLGVFYVHRFTWYAFTGFIIIHSTSSKWAGCDCILRPTNWPCIDTYILHLSIVPVDLYWEAPVGNTGFTGWNFHGVAQSLHTDSGIVPRLDHCCFLPYSFKFINHLTSYHWRYTCSLYGVVQLMHQKCNTLRKFGRPAVVYRQMVLLWIILRR